MAIWKSRTLQHLRDLRGKTRTIPAIALGLKSMSGLILCWRANPGCPPREAVGVVGYGRSFGSGVRGPLAPGHWISIIGAILRSKAPMKFAALTALTKQREGIKQQAIEISALAIPQARRLKTNSGRGHRRDFCQMF